MPIYFRNTPITEPFMFDSIGCGWEQERVSRPNGYPFYHYLQTETGCGKIMIQGKKYMLNEGEGILIAPFIRHSYSGESEKWLTLFATFTGTIEGSISKMLENRQVIFIKKEGGMKIRAFISAIIKKQENPPTDSKALSIDCYCLLMHFVDGVYTRNLAEDPLYERYVAPVIKEIETHYSTELTVRELSRQVYISPQYLTRLFSRFLGCSVYEYLTMHRLNKAKEFLMTAPNLEIQEIAGRVGFLDTSHFIVMFKKKTGMTPLEFRRLN